MDEKEIKEAVKDLTSGDDFAKLEAENKIAENLPDSLNVLHDVVLSETDKKTKLEIVRLMIDIKDPSSVDIFIKLLNDQNKWVRRESSSALTKYGDDVVDKLLPVTNNPNWRARGGAVWALSKIGNEKALDALLKAAEDEKSFVRSGSIFGLAKIGGDDAVTKLKYLSENDESNYVKAVSAQFLEEMDN